MTCRLTPGCVQYFDWQCNQKLTRIQPVMLAAATTVRVRQHPAKLTSSMLCSAACDAQKHDLDVIQTAVRLPAPVIHDSARKG